MKLDFGLTKEEKIIVRKKWHKWFAWYPVRIGTKDWRWGEFIWRRLNDSLFSPAWKYSLTNPDDLNEKNKQ